MLIAVLGMKGGSAKTTTSVHLAAALARNGARVALLDGDATRAATAWHARGDGRLPFAVRPVEDGPGDAEHVIVDTAGGEAPADLLDLARSADRVLMPTAPAPLDLVALLDGLRLLDGLDPRVLLTRCPPWPQTDAADARELLTSRGAHVLTVEVPARKLYQRAALDGVTVRDVRDRDAERLWAAWTALLAEVMA